LEYGIVALSFGRRSEEPNPVNQALARALTDIVQEVDDFTDSCFVVAQWEIALQLQEDGIEPDLTVGPEYASKHGNRVYLDTDDVLQAAHTQFRARGITKVIVVANPFIHLGAVRRMMESRRFEIETKYSIPKVGFDNDPAQLQWWCRGPLRTLLYGGVVLTGKMFNQDWHGIGERTPVTT
jgi:hypothetical protein